MNKTSNYTELSEFFNYKNFLINKYYNTYVNLSIKIINENRTYDRHTHEKHHILPNSMGGTVCLFYTYREHYIAHLLLRKFTKGVDKGKMYCAFHTFFHFDHIRNLNIRMCGPIYEAHKKEYSYAMRIKKPTIQDHNLYKVKDENNNIIIANRRELINKTKLSLYDMNYLVRVLKKDSRAIVKGYQIWNKDLNMWSGDIKINRSSIKNNLKIKCEHCGKLVSKANYARWHGKNCKMIDPKGHKSRSSQVTKLGKSNKL